MSAPEALSTKLEELWREVLELHAGESIAGVDFFSFGGNSLLAATFIERARDELAVDVPVEVMFMAADFFELAAQSRPAAAAESGPGDAAA